MTNIERMYYIASGSLLELAQKADAWLELAEIKADSKRFAQHALYFRAKAIVEFDREMDRLVKEFQ